MLVKCPECELPVSDKAVSCPHCGYPLKPETKKYSTRKSRRMRLPNGFGQISEIKNRNLRKPFRVMVTTGVNPETGRPICKLLQPEAYFKTYNEAYAALVEYNKDPYALDELLTMDGLYHKWAEAKFLSFSESSKRQYTAMWKYCESVYNVQVRELKISQIKYCIEEGVSLGKSGIPHKASQRSKRYIKILFNQMLDYAVENGLVDRNISRTYNTNTQREEAKHHIPYTDEELATLWENINLYGVDLILIQCYTGLRPQEIGLIEVENFKDWTITGGIKTDAGKNRIIPIHSRIQPLVQKRYEEALGLGSKYLFNHTWSKDGRNLKSKFLTYERYRDLHYLIVKELGLNPEHKAHDGRAHFATVAKKYNVDEYAIKRIIGHKIEDLTERVYTTRDIDWLKSEIEKIKE